MLISQYEFEKKNSELPLSVLFDEQVLRDNNINHKIKFGCINPRKS